MTPHRRQLEAALRAVTILSPTRFAWFGRPSPSLPRKTLRALDAGAARAYLVSQLRQRLYTGFYSAGSPTPDAPSNRAMHCSDFIHALSAANAGKGAWTSGWLVRSLEDGGIVGEREELRLRAPPGSFREPSAGAVRVGARVDLRMPKEQLGISPGHYLARSDVEPGTGFEATLVRVYWNATAAGALRLMARLTEALNALGLFFRFKVIGHPDGFTRCDSAVLYLGADDFDRAGPALARGFAAAARELGPAVPAFTKRLADGVAVAEDPAGSGSFGWHRCGLVAEGIVGAHERGIDTLEERVESVAQRFGAAGLNFDAPHLNPGSHDRYRLILGTRATGARAERHRGDTAPAAERALALSTRIGKQLAAAALWHEGRCTWLGPAPCLTPCAGAAPPRAHERRTLGPSLYDGTSGVGLFLAELAAVTKSDVLETAAIGAARQSLARLANHPASRNVGLYVGWPEVALAVARIGELTGNASLVDDARALVAANASRAHDARAFDVISGSAGGILALLSLGRSLGESGLLELDCALEATARAVERDLESGRAVDPGLMLGAAGLGLFLLRVARPATPSALWAAAKP